MKTRLTKTALERIPAPIKGRTTVYDTEEPGLAVQITSNNARTFLCGQVEGWTHGVGADGDS